MWMIKNIYSSCYLVPLQWSRINCKSNVDSMNAILMMHHRVRKYSSWKRSEKYLCESHILTWAPICSQMVQGTPETTQQAGIGSGTRPQFSLVVHFICWGFRNRLTDQASVTQVPALGNKEEGEMWLSVSCPIFLSLLSKMNGCGMKLSVRYILFP